MHPSLEYALICCVAAAGSFLLTPLARKLATRWGAVAWPRDRDVHAVATPRMGGVALFLVLMGLGWMSGPPGTGFFYPSLLPIVGGILGIFWGVRRMNARQRSA